MLGACLSFTYQQSVKKIRDMKAQRDLASKVSVAVEEVQLRCGLPASQKTSVVKYVFCSLMSW